MTSVPPESQAPQTPIPPAQPGNDANQMAMLAHLLGIFGFIGPLIIWLVKKEVPFVDDQAKEALNFEITVVIAWFAAFILGFIPFVGPIFGCFLVPAILIGNLILCIMAAMKAKDGVAYRYPFAIRLIK